MLDSSFISSPEKKSVPSPRLWSNEMSSIEQARERERERTEQGAGATLKLWPCTLWYKAPLFQPMLPSGQNGPIKGKPSVHTLLSDVHKIPIVITFWKAQNNKLNNCHCSQFLFQIFANLRTWYLVFKLHLLLWNNNTNDTIHVNPLYKCSIMYLLLSRKMEVKGRSGWGLGRKAWPKEV